jgi:hypothetical protein
LGKLGIGSEGKKCNKMENPAAKHKRKARSSGKLPGAQKKRKTIQQRVGGDDDGAKPDIPVSNHADRSDSDDEVR